MIDARSLSATDSLEPNGRSDVDGEHIDSEHVDRTVAKARAVTAWLDAAQSGGRAGRPSDLGALSADLSDLYTGSTRYQRLVDALLETPPTERESAADTVVDLKVELQHLAWHIRSVTRRLERLADDLYGDDEPDDVEGTKA